MSWLKILELKGLGLELGVERFWIEIFLQPILTCSSSLDPAAL